MIRRSFSIPSPACIHSSVDHMTPEEIKLMNDLLAKRRAWFIDLIHNLNNPLEARLANIDAALGSELDLEAVNNLLEEKAEILTALGKE
jgi:hypothetical protein